MEEKEIEPFLLRPSGQAGPWLQRQPQAAHVAMAGGQVQAVRIVQAVEAPGTQQVVTEALELKGGHKAEG